MSVLPSEKNECPRIKEYLRAIYDLAIPESSGMTALVTELSRLGRNLRQVLGIVEDLKDIGVNIYFQSQGMNTMKKDGTPDEMVNAMVSMFGALAEIERRQIADRLQSGRQHAIESWTTKLGRPVGTGLSAEALLKKYPEVTRRLRKGDRIRDIAAQVQNPVFEI